MNQAHRFTTNRVSRTNRHPHRPRAFTLIELLVVVAIISILAAILIGNMQQARIHALVARSKAEMETLRTGIQAYYLDNEAYPLDFNGIPGNDPDDEFSTWIQLTSPIPYISTVVFNPFKKKGAPHNNPHGSEWVYEYWGPPFWEHPQINLKKLVDHEGLIYILGTVGPNLEPDNALMTANGIRDLERGRAVIYDPTNGMASEGDILGSNKRKFY